MSKEFKCHLNDKQIECLKKLYDEAKSNSKKEIGSFEEFVQSTIDTAIDSHLKFVSFNEKMMNILDSTMNSVNNTPDLDLNNVDEFINNIFNNNINEKKSTKSKSDEKNKSTNSSKTSRIKN